MFGGRRRSTLARRPSRAPRGGATGFDSPDSGCVCAWCLVRHCVPRPCLSSHPLRRSSARVARHTSARW
eukprot:11184090-Lingulodinium_polyedra.AAC.1